MAKKDETREKTLEEMTAKELRAIGLTLEGVSGVHGMNKSELISAIKQARGIPETKSRKTSPDVRALKVKIQELRTKKVEAKEEGNRKLVDSIRRRISNLKKKTRRTA